MTNLDEQSWELYLSDYNFSMIEGGTVYEDKGDDPNVSDYSIDDIIKSVAFSLLALIGVSTNTVALTLLFKKRRKLQVTDIYLVGNFISNIIFLLIFVPVIAIYHGLSDWIFGAFLCKAVNYGMTACLAASMLAITVASLHNTFGCNHKQGNKQFLRRNLTALLITTGLAVVSAVALIPRVFLYSVVELWQNVAMARFCTRDMVHVVYRRVDSSIIFLALYLAPLLVQILCHIRSFRDLRKLALNGQNISKRLSVAKVLLGISIAVLIGWLPTHVIHFSEDFASDNSGRFILFRYRDLFTCGFSYACMSVSPVVYYIFQRRFRMTNSHTVSQPDEALILRSICSTDGTDNDDATLSKSGECSQLTITSL